MDTEDRDTSRVDAAIKELSEYLDTVQIFCTRYENNEIGTVSIQKGVGNWFARTGQIAEWAVKNDEYTKREVQKADE